MYFGTKSYLKSNRNYTAKHTLTAYVTCDDHEINIEVDT
jgi:hypothetical protein